MLTLIVSMAYLLRQWFSTGVARNLMILWAPVRGFACGGVASKSTEITAEIAYHYMTYSFNKHDRRTHAVQ